VKYGALSPQGGRLAVGWEVAPGPPVEVSLHWAESGIRYPGGAAPKRRGYGTQLIERALPYQLGAKTRLAFEPDGVRCDITVPLDPES
jgi:two-component sensor histidine kinase